MKLSIYKLEKNTEKSVYLALKKYNYKPKKSKVFIKPNIVGDFKPHLPYNTSLKVISGIIDYLRDIGITEIYVGDGPSDQNTKKVFQKSGYLKLCKRKNVHLVDLNDTERKTIKWKFGKLEIPKIIYDCEYINVAKAKTHIQTIVTLCQKNQKGLLTLPTKRRFHQNLHEYIAELSKAVKPDLNIMDMTDALEGNGPARMGITIKNINLLIVGQDAFEVDYITTKIMSIDPEKVHHLRLAKKKPKFSKEFLNDLEKYKIKFREPYETINISMLHVNYWWTMETCSGCTNEIAEIRNNILKNPKVILKLIYYLLKGKKVHFLTGRSKIPDEGKILCIGNCMHKIAKEHNKEIIKGCPPKAQEIVKWI